MAYSSIIKPSIFVNTKIYTGNGGTNAQTGVGFAPDLLWFKNRNTAINHMWFDSVRGINKYLYGNLTEAEGTSSSILTAIGSDGFTVGANDNVNKSSSPIVAWNWKAGTSVSGTTTGSGTGKSYSGSVNTTSGFSIIKYLGNGSSGHTIPHNLNAVPKTIIAKSLDRGTNWMVYHQAIGNTKYLRLNTTAATNTATAVWNDTTPTSSVFTVGSDGDVNNNDENYIAYIFAEKQGYSKMGSYIGNGNANGAFVYTGFKPALIIIKNSAGTDNWWIIDNKRSPFNQVEIALLPNENNVESTSDVDLDITSQGFKILSSSGRTNASGNKYIYMAFAENPFVASNFNAATAR